MQYSNILPMSAVQPVETPEPDPRAIRAEERQAMLRELAELAMTLSRATVRHAVEAMEAAHTPENTNKTPTAPPLPAAAPRHDPADTLATLSRIVRLTLTLEAKLEDGLGSRLAGAIAEARKRREEVAKDPFAPLKSGRKARVLDLVREAADREVADPEDHDILMDAVEERLLCDEAYADIDDLPLRDILERLCADVELRPDWRRWAGEGWKPNPPFTRPLCSHFARPSRSPILADLAEPDPLE